MTPIPPPPPLPTPPLPGTNISSHNTIHLHDQHYHYLHGNVSTQASDQSISKQRLQPNVTLTLPISNLFQTYSNRQPINIRTAITTLFLPKERKETTTTTTTTTTRGQLQTAAVAVVVVVLYIAIISAAVMAHWVVVVGVAVAVVPYSRITMKNTSKKVQCFKDNIFYYFY